MKTKLSIQLYRFLLAATVLAFAAPHVSAAPEGSTATVKLSAPGKPSSLRIDVPWADIQIAGSDGDVVVVKSSLSQKGASEDRGDGLRRLDDEVNFELTEQDNVVSLQLAGNPRANRDAEFTISVPRAMALDVKMGTGGDLVAKNVEGDIEVSNINGEVRLEGLVGSTVVSTMNGEVRATYAQPPQKLVSITSMNGEIDLRVPADTKANVRLRTHNGSILTDFDDSVLKTKSEGKSGGYTSEAAQMGAEAARVAAEAVRSAVQMAQEVAQEVQREVERATRENSNSDAPSPPAPPARPRSPRPPAPPVTGGKLVSGTLNGGGVDIKISTMNGEITLRRTNAALSSTKKVTVNFQDPDKFTDAHENHSNFTSDAYLEEFRTYIEKTATPLLQDRKLVMTFTDIDLAGDTNLSRSQDVRVVTDITLPRLKFDFQITDAGGTIIKEGKQNLSDMNFLGNIRLAGRDEALYHEKQLLQKWLRTELKRK